MKTTEQLVRECFCRNFCQFSALDTINCKAKCREFRLFARAARHFVKMEDKMLQEKRYNKINRELKKALKGNADEP